MGLKMNWNDRVRKARQTNLIDWLRQNNVPIKRAGQWWYIEGSDSLRIQANMWYRNSRGTGGNSIDFLVEYYGLTPKEAIVRLTRDAGCSLVKKSGVKEKEKEKNINVRASSEFDVGVIVPACDQRRVLTYLIKTRGIPSDIVLSEIQAGRLFQESQTGNAIFTMTNEAGDIVGAEVVGTLSFSHTRYKGLMTGSASCYGYAVGQKQNPSYVLYFESAVDLLSFITIMRRRAKPLTACLLVSMAGLKLCVVQKSLQTFGDSAAIPVPVLCVDNDDAGSEFISRCLTQYPTAIIKQPDKIFKDWNDQLLNKNIYLL